MLLRDIIDLEATYGGGPGSENDLLGEGEGEEPEPELEDEEAPEGEGDFDADNDEESLSLSMLEEKLKPTVMETFDKIEATHGKLFRLQTKRIAAIQGRDHRSGHRKKMEALKDELVDLVTPSV